MRERRGDGEEGGEPGTRWGLGCGGFLTGQADRVPPKLMVRGATCCYARARGHALGQNLSDLDAPCNPPRRRHPPSSKSSTESSQDSHYSPVTMVRPAPRQVAGRLVGNSAGRRVAGQHVSRSASRQVGRLASRQVGRSAGRHVSRSASRQVGRQVGRSAGWQVGRPPGRPVGRSAGRPVGRSAGRQVALGQSGGPTAVSMCACVTPEEGFNFD